MSYQCPNPTCRHADEVVPLAMITQPLEGQPWRQRKVGVHCRCPRCGTVFNISRAKGVYPMVGHEPPDLRKIVESFTEPVDKSASRRELHGLMQDARFPSEPGV